MFSNRKKELILCILSLLALVLAITTNVFATTPSDLATLLQNENKQNMEYRPSNNTANNTANNTSNNTANNTANNTSNNTSNNTANTNKNTNTPTTHPDAGLDSSILFVIGICGVSAVYAYKKIRDYNSI